MSVLSRSSCIKSAFLRSSRSRCSASTSVNPGFATFGARKIRSWGNDPFMSVNFSVLKCNDGFTNFASYSDKRRDNSHSEEKSEKKPESKWKNLSLAGAALFAIAQSRSTESNVFLNWLTVHAAEPVASDSDSNEFNSISSSEDASVENNPHIKTKSRRQQVNFIADVVESAARSVVFIQVKGFGGIAQSIGCGSGFIIRSDGLILTNAHVVNHIAGKTSLTVRLHDGRIFDGELYAIDSESDLALIRIKETNLPVLSLGCSSETRIGESVAAIGSPLTLSNSVTAGVVSSVSREHRKNKILISFLQTDATMTFGSSGGQLVNLDGDAIGVNSLSAKVAGISFAIPSDYVKLFLAEVDLRIKAGTTMPFNIRRYIGLTMIPLTEKVVADLKKRGVSHGVSQGVFVVNVVDGSEAFLAGIRSGDVIAKINGKTISSVKDVYDVLDLEVARAIPLEIVLMRGKKE